MGSLSYKNQQNNFSYDPDEIKDLYDYVIKESNKIRDNHEFISGFSACRLIEMLFHASAKQIGNFRGVLFAVYRYAGKADFIETDVATMKEILVLLQARLDSQDYDRDQIQMKQPDWLCRNLKMFISQME